MANTRASNLHVRVIVHRARQRTDRPFPCLLRQPEECLAPHLWRVVVPGHVDQVIDAGIAREREAEHEVLPE